MNAPVSLMKRWDWASGVLDCENCEGHGQINHRPWLHGNDPDNWIEECPDCEGEGHHPCQVCGYDQQQTGFDCLVCSTVVELEGDQLNDETAGKLADAIKVAIKARLTAKGEAS